MKYFLPLFLCLIPILAISQSSYLSKSGDKHLLGPIDMEALEEAPFSDWFSKNIDREYLLEKPESLSDTKVKIFMGTWCGDTRKWVPQFVKLWKDNNLPVENLEFIALHNGGDEYKRSPERLEAGLNIHRVPTFIFYDDGEERARIVESPINDLLTDVNQITLGQPSEAKYRAVAMLDRTMDAYPMDSLYVKKFYRLLLNDVYGAVNKRRELNTYGYVLLAKGELEKAEFVFYMNRDLFKWDPNTWDSLGEIYFERGKYEDSKTNYEKALELDPESENAKEMLKKIAAKT